MCVRVRRGARLCAARVHACQNLGRKARTPGRRRPQAQGLAELVWLQRLAQAE